MRHASYVTSIARSANANGYHFGAVIFRGREIISTGWCQCKTHPKQARFMKYAAAYKRNNSFLHAEIHALISAKTDVSGCDIVIARWAEDTIRDSYPCGACYQAITFSGIRRIWYWSQDNWQCESA